MRIHCCLLILFLVSRAPAQDMPLFSIIKAGEGWRQSPALVPLQTPVLVSKAGFRYEAKPDKPGIHIRKQNAGDGTTQELPLKRPGPMVFWPDEGTLVIADNGGRHLWAFRVEKDGSLSAGDRYYALRTPIVRERSGRSPQPAPGDTVETTALLMDGAYRLYAATEVGIQIFDPTGRLCGVITSPAPGKVTELAFAGPDRDELVAVVDGKTYQRKMLARGIGAAADTKK